jgi:hypothetical protein
VKEKSASSVENKNVRELLVRFKSEHAAVFKKYCPINNLIKLLEK